MVSGCFEGSVTARFRRGLLEPALRVSAIDLARQFRIDHVTVTAQRPPDFQAYPDLPVRIRGALGRMLHTMGPPLKRWRTSPPRPRAWDVLMESCGKDIAKPMAVHADVSPETVTVTVRLAGASSYWSPDVLSALVTALDHGIKFSDDASYTRTLDVMSAGTGGIGGFEPPSIAVGMARLVLETPLRLRTGSAERLTPASFLISLANRVKALAAWQYLGLDEDWDALHAAAWQVSDAGSFLTPYRWDRGSQRAHRKIPVMGSLGLLSLSGPLERFVPYLQICEVMNAGSHASLGLGRYRMAVLP